MIIEAISFLFLVANLILAILVFVLIARPERLMGLLAYLGRLQEEWRSRRLSLDQEEQLLNMAKRMQLVALLLLLGCSFFSGAIIAYLQLL